MRRFDEGIKFVKNIPSVVSNYLKHPLNFYFNRSNRVLLKKSDVLVYQSHFSKKMQLQKKIQPRGARHRASVSETLSDGSHDTYRFAQPLLALPPRGSQPPEVSSRRARSSKSSGGVQPRAAEHCRRGEAGTSGGCSGALARADVESERGRTGGRHAAAA